MQWTHAFKFHLSSACVAYPFIHSVCRTRLLPQTCLFTVMIYADLNLHSYSFIRITCTVILSYRVLLVLHLQANLNIVAYVYIYTRTGMRV